MAADLVMGMEGVAALFTLLYMGKLVFCLDEEIFPADCMAKRSLMRQKIKRLPNKSTVCTSVNSVVKIK